MHSLVKKAQRGDPDAFVSLIEQCKGGMYRIAKGFFAGEADVADAISEAVLAAYEHIGELKNPQYFRTWLMRILINTCNRMIRDNGRYEMVEAVPETAGAGEGFADVEFREMLASIPEDSRAIVLLYYGEQFTTREIAQILAVNENTVRSRLRRIRGELRRTLVYSI